MNVEAATWSITVDGQVLNAMMSTVGCILASIALSGSGSVWQRSLTLFEMTHGLCSCHFEQSEESFSILRVHAGLKMNDYPLSRCKVGT